MANVAGGGERAGVTGEQSEARERVLDAAERLFVERGYTTVTLRDIAAEVGIRHTSLYHHAPGGKEELYVEVMERNFRRHRDGMLGAIAQAAPNIRAQLRAVADWLLSQPPMDFIRMAHSDLRSIEPAQAERLSLAAYEATLVPVTGALEQAQARGEIAHDHLGMIAGGLVGMLESLFSAPIGPDIPAHNRMAYELIDVLLDGLRPRE